VVLEDFQTKRRNNKGATFLKYIKMKKEEIIDLLKQVKFEEFEVYPLIRKE
jgi:hypothetical protein